MTKKTKLFMTAWSVLVLILVLVNIVIGLGNQSIQAEVTERQQEIAQTIQLEALNRQLVTVLASMPWPWVPSGKKPCTPASK